MNTVALIFAEFRRWCWLRSFDIEYFPETVASRILEWRRRRELKRVIDAREFFDYDIVHALLETKLRHLLVDLSEHRTRAATADDLANASGEEERAFLVESAVATTQFLAALRVCLKVLHRINTRWYDEMAYGKNNPHGDLIVGKLEFVGDRPAYNKHIEGFEAKETRDIALLYRLLAEHHRSWWL